MIKKYDVIAKKNNLVLFTYIVYDKKLDKMLLKQFKKIGQVNISEVKCEEKI